MIVEVILTGLETKPIFHISMSTHYDEYLCISYSFPRGISPWSKKMFCCRGLKKVSSNGLELPWGRRRRCLMVLTKSGRDRQNPAWVCVREQREHKNVTKLVKPVPVLGFFSFGFFQYLAKRREIDVAWLVFYGFALEVFLVDWYMGTWALAAWVSSLFSIRGSTAALPNPQLPSTAHAELGINPEDSWRSDVGVLAQEQANGLRRPWGIGCTHPMAWGTSECSPAPTMELGKISSIVIIAVM